MTTGIPLQTLAAQAGIALPIASGFGTQTGTGTGTHFRHDTETSPLWQQIAGGVLGAGAYSRRQYRVCSAFKSRIASVEVIDMASLLDLITSQLSGQGGLLGGIGAPQSDEARQRMAQPVSGLHVAAGNACRSA